MLELQQVPVSEVPIARNLQAEKEISSLAKHIYESLKKDPQADVSDLKSHINRAVLQMYQLEEIEIVALRDFINKQAPVRRVPSHDVFIDASDASDV